MLYLYVLYIVLVNLYIPNILFICLAFFYVSLLVFPSMLMPIITPRCAHWPFIDVNMHINLEIEEFGDFGRA